MKYRKVTIQWWDAGSKAEWIEGVDDLPKLQSIVTSGYKVQETATSITICASLHSQDDGSTAFGDCVTIPSPWLKAPRRRKASK